LPTPAGKPIVREPQSAPADWRNTRAASMAQSFCFADLPSNNEIAAGVLIAAAGVLLVVG